MKPLHANRRQTAAWRPLLLALLAGCVLTACAPGMSDLQAWVADVKARPPKPLDPLPVMRQFETFEYSGENQRDPFSEPMTDEASALASSALRPDPGRRKEPLESFPLDGLNMVGTLGSDAEMVALIMDPERVVYKVTVGNYMGQNDGRIDGVFDDHINLTELVPDGAGGWIERKAQVALADK